MLLEITIENLAVIEKATISFGDKLNIFTGETGAGKSILIGGINAILGQRIYKDIVRAGAEKAIVTALFDDIPDIVVQKLNELGYTIEENQLLLQREICSDGRSVARIDGKTSTVAVLKEIGSYLVNIHGQNDNRLLMSNDNQREVLDKYGNLNDYIEEYRKNFRNFSLLTKKIKQMQLDEKEKKAAIERLTAEIDEISEYDFHYDEDIETENELTAVRNSARIQAALHKAYFALSGDDGEEEGSISLIEKAVNELDTVADVNTDKNNSQKRLEEIIIELEDISQDLYEGISDYNDSEQRLQFLEERMSQIKHIKRKYNMELNEIIDYLEKCRFELSEIEDSDDAIAKLTEERKILGETVKEMAEKLTQLRKISAKSLCDNVAEQLTFLDMPNVQLIFQINPDKVTINGMDSVEMLISVNKGETPKPINKVASGGELSRIMLAIKNALAENDDIPTQIFDEVDTGISGRAANKVAIKLSEIAQRRQILCVTHLPQIAAMADTHLLIEKQTNSERTFTDIFSLDFSGRVKEIARIIDGDGTNELTLKNAEEMLTRRDSYKKNM